MAYLPGLGRELMKAAADAPFLERDEEKQLAIAWRDNGDRRALHKLTAAHMRLVIAISAKFRHYGLPIADLVQEGHVGLLEAAARFAPERDVRFSTYATWWIRASIQDYVLRNWSIVRGGTSSTQKALFFNLRRLRARLAREPEAFSTGDAYDRIAQTLGVSRADVEMMDSRLSGSDVSLNAQLVDDESAGSAQRMDFLVDDAPLPDEVVEQNLDTDRRARWLKDALAILSERELRIVQERRLTENLVTLETLGDKLGISKERVRQIESRALTKLRRALSKLKDDDAPDEAASPMA
ncbi:RNA polymerase factor sigma-32 [Methylocystis parvus]|uniref:RNA polymerase factor sigma-32 n=1 Tax=Methylocystis parvus TaxID=134 RepID=UPI003C752915